MEWEQEQETGAGICTESCTGRDDLETLGYLLYK